MAYTILFLKDGSEKRDRVRAYLQARLVKDGRFRCELVSSLVPTSKTDRLDMAKFLNLEDSKKVFSVPAILVQKVRLIKAKSYCGNHPGPCPLSDKRKPVSTLLEWDDWVAFHDIVNKVLNRFRVAANVWSLPYDVKGRMWIRQGTQARKRYDWEEIVDSYGRTIRHWNPGTEDQFA